MFRYILLGLTAITLSSCATVNNSGEDYFRIDSVPQGATAVTSIETKKSLSDRRKNSDLEPVYVSCSPTPCAIKLPRRSKFIVKLEHPGYEDAELFIAHSSKSGSFTANMLSTTATSAGTTVASAAISAALSTIALQTTTLVGTALANSLTFGAVPVTAGTASISTATVLSSAIPPALAVTGGALLIDAASGANQNLYPNPVVLKLAPKGSPTVTDLNVVLHRLEIEEDKIITTTCAPNQNSKECKNIKEQVRTDREKRKELLSEIPLNQNEQN